jgi:hypothetical protein
MFARQTTYFAKHSTRKQKFSYVNWCNTITSLRYVIVCVCVCVWLSCIGCWCILVTVGLYMKAYRENTAWVSKANKLNKMFIEWWTKTPKNKSQNLTRLKASFLCPLFTEYFLKILFNLKVRSCSWTPSSRFVYKLSPYVFFTQNSRNNVFYILTTLSDLFLLLINRMLPAYIVTLRYRRFLCRDS